MVERKLHVHAYRRTRQSRDTSNTGFVVRFRCAADNGKVGLSILQPVVSGFFTLQGMVVVAAAVVVVVNYKTDITKPIDVDTTAVFTHQGPTQLRVSQSTLHPN